MIDAHVATKTLERPEVTAYPAHPAYSAWFTTLLNLTK